MILLRTKNVERKERIRKGPKRQSRQLYNRTLEIQENPSENQTEILLRQNNWRHKIIYTEIYKVSTRERLLQKRD